MVSMLLCQCFIHFNSKNMIFKKNRFFLHIMNGQNSCPSGVTVVHQMTRLFLGLYGFLVNYFVQYLIYILYWLYCRLYTSVEQYSPIVKWQQLCYTRKRELKKNISIKEMVRRASLFSVFTLNAISIAGDCWFIL